MSLHNSYLPFIDKCQLEVLNLNFLKENCHGLFQTKEVNSFDKIGLKSFFPTFARQR